MSEIPWFWPGAAVSLLVGLALGDRVAGLVGGRRANGSLLIVAFGLIVSATLTPGREAIEAGVSGVGGCDIRRILPAGPLELLAASEAGLNVLLFVPLGLAVGLLPGGRLRAVLAMLGLALPAAIEGLQMIALPLDRVCESADIADNMTGVALGLAVGWLGARWVRSRER